MRTYEQYCPIARAAEVFAERWTPLIVRNIHAGSSTYGEILAGLPGMSHTMLTQRLRHLVRAGVVTTAPKESGFGVRYVLTDAGNELWPVLLALGAWGERWVELRTSTPIRGFCSGPGAQATSRAPTFPIVGW
jgi:DNA-binding HxlR family transcriptional regulator